MTGGRRASDPAPSSSAFLGVSAAESATLGALNIVEALTLQLKLPDNAARGLAGQLLGLVEDTIREKISYGVASRIRDAVPEMIAWQTATPTLAPGSLHINDLPLPTPAGEEAELDGLLERFRIPKGETGVVTSLTLQFLSSRLDTSTISHIARAMPVLTRREPRTA